MNEELDARDWFEQEPPLRKTATATVRRLFRRSLASWPIWLTICLLASGALAFRRAIRPPLYSSTVLIRVTEGVVTTSGSALRTGNLRAFLEEMVFTSKNLLDMMNRHPDRFPDARRDPVSVVETLRSNLEIGCSGSELLEDAESPIRHSARISLTFDAAEPQVAWQTAKDLASLVTEVSLRDQRLALQREQAVAQMAARQRGEQETNLLIPDAGGSALPPAGEGLLLRKTQEVGNTADIGMRALEQGQLLAFDIIDAGHPPVPRDERLAVLVRFVLVLIATSLAAGLVAGAFDPRVVDGDDLAAIGLPILARFPALPRGKNP